MSAAEALALFNTATKSTITESELRHYPSVQVAIANLIKAAAMAERMGGRLRSRQIIATIILFSLQPTP